ncbi:MAG: CinA family protein [Spirochaeta sp.]
MASAIANRAVQLLVDRQMTVAFAESCTGGRAAAMIAEVPGCSRALWGGWVVYSNDAKHHCLAVQNATLQTCGAVSEEVVRELLQGVFMYSPVDCAVAISGIAGPQGGTPQKPVGYVWIGVALRNRGVSVVSRHFDGNRLEIQQSAAEESIKMIEQQLLLIDK